MLTGENGILKRAIEAKEKTDLSQKQEKNEMSKIEELIKENVDNVKVEQVEDAAPGELEKEDEALVGKIYSVINKIAKEEGVDEKGFRVVVNCKEDGGQEVPHLHFHIIGGKKLGTKIC